MFSNSDSSFDHYICMPMGDCLQGRLFLARNKYYDISNSDADCSSRDFILSPLNMTFTTLLLVLAFVLPIGHVTSKPPWQFSEIGFSVLESEDQV